MNGTKRKVAFHTLGCKLNFAETSTISRSFPDDQFERVPAGESADIYVINTCSVTDTADRKCRQAIRKFINRSPGAFIAVVGCYAQLKPKEVSEIPGVDLVLGTNEKFDISSYLNITEKKEKADIYSCDPGKSRFYPSYSMGDRTRSFLKVQDGCDYGCSYCTIPLARGGSRNQKIEVLLKEAAEIAGKGVKEIVLTGVNVGDFGRTTGETFASLLKELTGVEGIERYRISSIEPNLLTDEIIELAAGNKKILPHFHIPLQSGNNKILALMRRRYNRELFAGRVRRIKDNMPFAGIGADVITGFPGETDQDFLDTYGFLDELPLSYLHVFNYSERPGTLASGLPGKVPFPEREKRSRSLINMSAKKHLGFCELNTGRVSRVLFEHTRDNGMITGFTENYIRTEYKWQGEMAGRVIPVRLKGISESGRMSAELTE